MKYNKIDFSKIYWSNLKDVSKMNSIENFDQVSIVKIGNIMWKDKYPNIDKIVKIIREEYLEKNLIFLYMPSYIDNYLCLMHFLILNIINRLLLNIFIEKFLHLFMKIFFSG